VNALLVQVSRRLDEHEAAVDRRVTVRVGEQLEARVVRDLAESPRPHGAHPAWIVLRDRHELKVDVGEDDGVVPKEGGHHWRSVALSRTHTGTHGAVLGQAEQLPFEQVDALKKRAGHVAL
jgi:hypothetical protein